MACSFTYVTECSLSGIHVKTSSFLCRWGNQPTFKGHFTWTSRLLLVFPVITDGVIPSTHTNDVILLALILSFSFPFLPPWPFWDLWSSFGMRKYAVWSEVAIVKLSEFDNRICYFTAVWAQFSYFVWAIPSSAKWKHEYYVLSRWFWGLRKQ